MGAGFVFTSQGWLASEAFEAGARFAGIFEDGTGIAAFNELPEHAAMYGTVWTVAWEPGMPETPDDWDTLTRPSRGPKRKLTDETRFAVKDVYSGEEVACLVERQGVRKVLVEGYGLEVVTYQMDEAYYGVAV